MLPDVVSTCSVSVHVGSHFGFHHQGPRIADSGPPSGANPSGTYTVSPATGDEICLDDADDAVATSA